MKILFISHEYPPVGGGGAVNCIHLANQFAGRGHDVHVLSVQFAGTPSEEVTLDGHLKVIRVPARRSSADSSSFFEMLDYLFKARTAADRMCAEQRYDCCLCFFGLPGGVLADYLKSRYGLPYVVRLGGGDIPGGQDRFSFLYKVLSPRLRRIWKNAGALTANSEGLKQEALKFCSKYNISVIYNGVDTEIFKPAETDCSDDRNEIRLLTVCRLLERKGIQDVIPYISRIEEKTGKKVRWIVVGDGPYRKELEGLAKQYSVDDRISFTGYKAKASLPDIYRSADVFVYPSHYEGMPNVVLEAMACGLPVIMRADCQGSEELINGNGIAAEGDFTAELQELISMSRDELQGLGEKSREIVMKGFNWELTADKYEALLLDLVR